MRKVVGTGRTDLPIVAIECLYLRYLKVCMPNRYDKNRYIVTETEKFLVYAGCDSLIDCLIPGKEYFFQIITMSNTDNRVIIDVLENQLENNEKQ